MDAGPFGQKYKSPGGEAIGFYSSLSLRCFNPQKIRSKRTIHGVAHDRVQGIKVEIEVFKSSVWKPYRQATVHIIFDYGIDDIRGNLEYLKATKASYTLNDVLLGKTLDRAIQTVENEGLEKKLQQEVIKLWNEVEIAFAEPRRPRNE
jgi:hypothetical protein